MLADDQGRQGGVQGSDAPAIPLLLQQHRQLRALIDRYRQAPPARRPAVASELLDQLDAHGKLEREVLYPAVRLYGGAGLRQALAQRVAEHRELDLRHAEAVRSGAYLHGGASWDDLIRSLEAHMDAEESQFFPVVAERLGDRLPGLAAELERAREEFTFDYDDVVEGTFPASDPPATMAAPRVDMPQAYRPPRS